VRVGGIDEAGRGCVLGPLAVAGVCIEQSRLDELLALGVKDSKLLSPRQRDSLYPEILKLCERVEVSRIPPRIIDRYVQRGKKYRRLNYLEAIHMAKVIEILGVEEVYIDAPDTNPARFQMELEAMLSCKPRIIAEHKADLNYAVVSAASIVAKVERDSAVAELRDIHGDFGSGYPSDPDTIAFLESWVRSKNSQPEFSRKSWKTWERIMLSVLPTLD
jgi:ribonuclease HII